MKINKDFWFINKKYYLRSANKFWYSLRILKNDIFSLKAIIIKIYVFLTCCAILIPISLHLEHWALSISLKEVNELSHSLISVQPIGNSGIEFSFLSSTPIWLVFLFESITIFLSSTPIWLVFLFESITIFLSFFCLIITTYKPWLIIPISFCLIGGIMNLDSRASTHEYINGSYYEYMHLLSLNPINNVNFDSYKNFGVVIDYWYFHTGQNYAIFNLNDTLVISGSIGYILFIFITFIYIYTFPNRHNKI